MVTCGVSVFCRCSLLVAEVETHVLIILIAYFLMFVYRMATCRHEVNHIYCLWLLTLFSLTHTSKHTGRTCLVWFIIFPLISCKCNVSWTKFGASNCPKHATGHHQVMIYYSLVTSRALGGPWRNMNSVIIPSSQLPETSSNWLLSFKCTSE